MPTNTIKKITIRFPHDLWTRVRRAEERGLVSGFQDAATRGTAELLDTLEKAEDPASESQDN